MIILGWEIYATRWPWHKGYSWRGMTKSQAPLNAGGARFGGGWKWKLGIAIGGSSAIVDLLFGSIRIQKAKRCTVCNGYMKHGDRSAVGWLSKEWPVHEGCAPAKEEAAKEDDYGF